MKNKAQLHINPFSTFRIRKQNWKILFLSRVNASWKWYIDFQFFSRLVSAKLWRPRNQLISWFQKLSRCSTIVPNFMFLAYPFPKIWTSGKNNRPRAYKDPKKLGPHRVNDYISKNYKWLLTLSNLKRQGKGRNKKKHNIKWDTSGLLRCKKTYANNPNIGYHEIVSPKKY